MLIQRFKAVKLIVVAAIFVAFGVPVTAADSTLSADYDAPSPALALKTNLLLDAASLVNLGLEVPIGGVE